VTPPQVCFVHVLVVALMVAAGAATAAAAFLFAFLVFFLDFFALCFFALCCGAGCAACTDGALEDGADAVSAAQAGATIKANNNSNRFFFTTFLPLQLKNIHGLAYAKPRLRTTHNNYAILAALLRRFTRPA
jgi:hypothetical protein